MNDFVLSTGFNKVGDWTVVDTNPGKSYMYEFTVTFMVIPESVIGALAVVLPSMGAFAGYKVLRSKSK
jgi:secreted protein with Ig-like and vWFA domain